MQEHHRFTGLFSLGAGQQRLQRAVLLGDGIDEQMPDVEINLRWPGLHLQSSGEGSRVRDVEVGVAGERHEGGTGSFDEGLEHRTRQEGDVVAAPDQIGGDSPERDDMPIDRGGGDDDACHVTSLGCIVRIDGLIVHSIH